MIEFDVNILTDHAHFLILILEAKYFTPKQ